MGGIVRTRKRLIDLMRSVNADVIGANHAEWMKEAAVCLASRASCSTCTARMQAIVNSPASPDIRDMAFDAVVYLTKPHDDPEEEPAQAEEADAGGS